jgi:outer membrane receptor protein involved in Fe transport
VKLLAVVAPLLPLWFLGGTPAEPPTKSGGEPAEAPRVQSLCTHCNAANVQLAGLSKDLVSLRRDGAPIVDGLSASYLLSILPDDSVERIRLRRALSDASQPAAAAGGVIEFTSATGERRPFIDLSAELGTFDFQQLRGRISIPLALDWNATLTVGHARADAIDGDDDRRVDAPAIERDYVDGLLQWKPDRDRSLRFGTQFIDERNRNGRGGFDAVRFVLEGVDAWTREDSLFQRREGRLQWRQRGGNVDWSLAGLIADHRQRQRSQLSGDANFLPGADQLIDRFSVAQDHLWFGANMQRRLGQSFVLGAGGEYRDHEVRADSLEPLQVIVSGMAIPQRAFERVRQQGVFLDGRWIVGAASEFRIGLRHQQFRLTTRLESPLPSPPDRRHDGWLPRLGWSWFAADGLQLSAFVSRSLRAPKPILAEICCGQRYQTTENARVESATHFGAELNWSASPRLTLSLFAARSDFKDHLLRVVGWSQAFIQTYALTNIPRARADRAEATLRWKPTAAWILRASASLLSFENRDDSIVDVFVSPPSFGGVIVQPIALKRVPYVPQRSASLNLSYDGVGVTNWFVQIDFNDEVAIQSFERLAANSSLRSDSLQRSDSFWLVATGLRGDLNRDLGYFLRFENLINEIQSDLGDPTTDYNWGPLSGRAFRAGLTLSLGR